MALRPCPVCGKMISEKAERCPKCGVDLSQVVSPSSNGATSAPETLKQNSESQAETSLPKTKRPPIPQVRRSDENLSQSRPSSPQRQPSRKSPKQTGNNRSILILAVAGVVAVVGIIVSYLYFSKEKRAEERLISAKEQREKMMEQRAQLLEEEPVDEVGLEMPEIEEPEEELLSMDSYFANKSFTVKGVSFDMIAVEGGTFQMGATSEQGNNFEEDEKPVHSVTLSDYWIGETEVTQELWRAVMGYNPSGYIDSRYPVESVSWYDCKEFVEKLNSLTEGSRPAGTKFRLPTEAEWEYAARGGKHKEGYKYSGSNNIDQVAWDDDRTHAVATKQANALGIYDMTGNVGEWCADWYNGDYYSNSPSQDPLNTTESSYRVFRGRGGFWVTYRDFQSPGCIAYDGYGDFGVRLALSSLH